MAGVERIGIIFVHGIGDHTRFEHLDSEIRPLIEAIARRSPKPAMTVEIVGGGDSPLHANQDTWAGGPSAPIRIAVRDRCGDKDVFVHEVWWADVNEPYSLMKEVRFWGWGLSVWSLPNKLQSKLADGSRLASERFKIPVMTVPSFPPEGLTQHDENIARLKLFAVSNVFLMGAFSIGALVFLAKRLFNFSAPDLVRVFVNYLSAVKLYSQSRRVDGGFLDAYGEPPRVSVRRRMIRTVADVATAGYDRWYVLAHSLGSVVAFNGLMENGHALPNYLDEKRWQKLKNYPDSAAGDERFGGTARPDRDNIGTTGDMTPARPLWLETKDVVRRDHLLQNFRGLLTYGSPLDKFATIWPARVPINVGERDFHPDAEWINVYDPTDPVGASLDAFGSKAAQLPDGVLQPANYGYRAHWALLYSHLCYLNVHEGRDELSDKIIEWIFSGEPFARLVNSKRKPWFEPKSGADIRRIWWARVMWAIAYAILVVLAVLSLHLFGRLFDEDTLIWQVSHWIVDRRWKFAVAAISLSIAVLLAVLLAGTIARLFVFRRDRDDVATTGEAHRPTPFHVDHRSYKR